ncbi:MAG: TetR/AcrR family transcriptional regulator, partial [Pseudonocardiaceae bacterium]
MARADRERQMLEVAEELFAERGYQAASMDEIAERVGVSKPMLYAYFGSKDGLLLGCVRRARAELREVTMAAIAQGGTPYEVLRRGLIAHFRFIDAHTSAWAILRTEAALA